ncbi:MAG: hypothetical protein NTY38_09605 [Acidobacteria bacterium]|nr:hypothetical protein [Acidobacteriota bacterium]
MSTPAQIHANQQNATRSTGPRTPEGKAASASNSTRHGLTGNFHLLPGEDPADYSELFNEYANEFQPATEHESFLVIQMIEARWKLERIERLQGEAFEQLIASGDQTQSPNARIVAALNLSSPALDRLQRYAAQAERTYHRAHRELVQLTRQRVKEHAAAFDANLNRIINAPLPNQPGYEAYRTALRNEANPVPPTPAKDDRALRL